VYIDFTKAFDSVEIWVLRRILRYYNFPDKFVNIIMEVYKSNTVEIFTPIGSNGEKHPINRGIKQGCVLSPLLFNLYMNPLLEALEVSNYGYTFARNTNLRIPAVQFVDDLTLIANSKENMQGLIEIVESFCRDTGMKENLSYSAITHDLHKIKDKCFTLKQKCSIINTMIIPKVTENNSWRDFLEEI
jgi:hypothetical protein